MAHHCQVCVFFATVLAGLFGRGGHVLHSCYYLYGVEGTKDPFSFPPANFVSPALQWAEPGDSLPLVILHSQYYKSPAASWGDS